MDTTERLPCTELNCPVRQDALPPCAKSPLRNLPRCTRMLPRSVQH